MKGYDALWRTNATVEEQEECYQRLINAGDAWTLEGHVGRTAMSLIEHGTCMLGFRGHRDFYGNYIPARNEVAEGTKGSFKYVAARRGEEHAKNFAAIGRDS